MLAKVSATLLLFVTITVFATLVLLIPWFPKTIVATESVTGCKPVPVRFTVCGLLLALSAIESVAVITPVVAGVKVTLIVHEECPASDAAQVVPETAKALAFVPEIVFPDKLIEALVLLVSVTALGALVFERP